MIELHQVRLREGDKILFDIDQLRIADGWHLGITGRNGTGKTSFFRLLEGKRDADQGTLFISKGQRLAVMAQEVAGSDQPALDYVLAGDERLLAAQQTLKDAEASEDGHAIGLAHATLDALNAWSAPARAAELMAGLGFTNAQQQRPVADFSGGWRVRLNLARTLMANADVLLLDEPTNHLDLDAILWLSDTLAKYPGTLLLVSHDRYFLDRCVGHILHIEQQTMTHYQGNYTAFESQRAEQLSQQQKAFDKQQKQREHLQQFIDRFQAQATKARQAQSRVKALNRLQLSAPAQIEAGFSFQIPAPERLPNPLLTLKNASCGYDKPLINHISLHIEPGTRFGLLGANGAGKSTLIRTLAGLLPILGGDRETAPDLVIGYFHQQQVDELDLNASLFDLMQQAQPNWAELDVRKELGRFGFHGDEVFSPTGQFSGGEKTRLALGLLVQQKPALLLLDEPTNHLDINMRDALALALQEYSGAILLISHDRSLLEACVDEYLLVDDGQVTTWKQDLDAYARLLRDKRNTPSSSGETARPVQASSKEKRQQAALLREKQRPFKKKADKLEKQLDACNQTLAEIQTQLGDEGLYTDANKDELQQLLAKQTELNQQQEQLEEALLDVMEEMEAMQ